MTGRRAAAVAALVLGGALVVAVVALVPRTAPPPLQDPATLAAVDAEFTAAEAAAGERFAAAVRPASYGGLVVGLGVSLALGPTPLGGRVVAAAARPVGGGWVSQAVLGGLAVGLLGRLGTLPFAVWTEIVLRRAGLSTQGWSAWTGDLLKAAGLGAVLSGAVLVAFYALVRAIPQWWWAWAAGGGAALVVALSFAFPLVVEPLFNRFTTMPPSPLRTELLELAERDGVAVREVLVADASRRTTALNAYVSGFGASRRIVVYDTLLRDATPAEVRSVVAHELGHAADRDVLTGTALGALGAAVACCAGHVLLGWPALLRLAGVRTLGDPRSLALLAAIASAAALVSAPAQSEVSRRIETRADLHALRLTGDPGTFVAMQRRLAVQNRADLSPPPLLHAVFASHPSVGQRIALARAAGAPPPPGPAG